MFLIAFHRMTANHSWATCRESKDSAWISYTKVCGINIKLWKTRSEPPKNIHLVPGSFLRVSLLDLVLKLRFLPDVKGAAFSQDLASFQLEIIKSRWRVC